jgi:hypothetical protein
MNASGTVLWQHAYAQSGINEPRTIIEDAQGAFLICGQYFEGHTALITKIDAEGTFLWSDAVGAAGYGMSMSPCAAGFVITGSTTYPDHQSLNDVMFLMVGEDPTNIE